MSKGRIMKGYSLYNGHFIIVRYFRTILYIFRVLHYKETFEIIKDIFILQGIFLYYKGYVYITKDIFILKIDI